MFQVKVRSKIKCDVSTFGDLEWRRRIQLTGPNSGSGSNLGIGLSYLGLGLGARTESVLGSSWISSDSAHYGSARDSRLISAQLESLLD